METWDKEATLLDYIEIAWKKKWLIIIPAFICALAAGVVTSFLTPKWEVDSIVLPGKFFVQTEAGAFEEIDVIEPKQIAGQINQASYNQRLADELDLDIRKFPRLKAENLRDTKLVRISVRSADVERARRILSSLFVHLKREMDKRIEVEMRGIDTSIALKESAIKENRIGIKDLNNLIAQKELLIDDQENAIRAKENEIKKTNNDIKIKDLEIQARELDKERIKMEIESDRNKLEISEARAASIAEEMKTVKGRVETIDGQLQNALGERKKAGDAVGLLLYSNEVQQNLRFYSTLDERLSSERITRENILLAMRAKQEALRQIDNQISQTSTVRDNLRAVIDDIQTSIAVIRTGIQRIGTEVVRVNNEIEKIGNANDKLRQEMTLLEDRRGRIDHARLVKEPTSSLYPVFPRKIESVLVAGFLGFIGFTGIAIFVDRLQSRSRQRAAAAARANGTTLPWAAATAYGLNRRAVPAAEMAGVVEPPRLGDEPGPLDKAACVGRTVSPAGDF